MVPPDKLTQLINHTVEDLPYDKKQEVYDFAVYLKSKTKNSVTHNISTLGNMIGILEGPPDLASNHDEIYD